MILILLCFFFFLSLLIEVKNNPLDLDEPPVVSTNGINLHWKID